jgi:hypothetical protein
VTFQPRSLSKRTRKVIRLNMRHCKKEGRQISQNIWEYSREANSHTL